MMLSKAIDEASENWPNELSALIKLLRYTTSKKEYHGLIEKELTKYTEYHARQPYLNYGFFDETDLIRLLSALSTTEIHEPHLVMTFLGRLVDWGLVLESTHGPLSRLRYRWNGKKIAIFNKLQAIDNIILGKSFVAKKYKPSIPAVIIEKDGEEAIGTCFVAAVPTRPGKHVMVTAKHNVDKKSGISFKSFYSSAENAVFHAIDDDWTTHPTLDIAVMRFSCELNLIPVFPVGSPVILTQTISLGYPTIATTDSPYLLAHGGELEECLKNLAC